MAHNLTAFMCRLSGNLGISDSCKGPVQGLHYMFYKAVKTIVRSQEK
jgi:hypothetical protein